MIYDAKTLAQRLEDKLNAAVPESGINNRYPNVSFRFSIASDAKDFRRAEREERGNGITVYINGVQTVSGSAVSGTGAETYSAGVDTTLELLVPTMDETDENGTLAFVSTVRDILVSALVSDGGQTVVEEDGSRYYMSTVYSIATTGERDQRNTVGDSITISADISYTFVANGIGSHEMKIEVRNAAGEYEEIHAAKSGMRRVAISEGAIPSNSYTASSVAVVSGSSLTVNIINPARGGYIDYLINDYLLNGNIPRMTVRITLPTGYAGNDYTRSARAFTMTFSDAMLDAAENMGMTDTYTFVEVL